MNKAAAAGIGILVVVIAIGALFAMTEESDMQTEISDEIVAAEEPKSYEVELSEDLDVGDTP